MGDDSTEPIDRKRPLGLVEALLEEVRRQLEEMSE